MFRRKKIIILFLICIIGAPFIVYSSIIHPHIKYTEHTAYNGELGALCIPTQFSYEDGKELISDYDNHRILYKDVNKEWQQSPIKLTGAHSIRYLKNVGFLIDDTEANRLVKIDDLTGKNIQYLYSIDGYKLNRPHDILIGPDGYAYVVDANNIFRIKDLSGNGERLNINNNLYGYARSLSLMDGLVYIVSASKGNVIRINNFAKNDFTIFHTSAHKVDDGAGAWDRTGPILNSITKYDGFYYGSNFFIKSYAQGHDVNPNRFIRWKSWDDFVSGNFEDLSNLIPKGLVPYLLSTKDDKLLIAIFNSDHHCHGDSVVYLTEN